jgi:hypothetical protein
MAELTVIRWRDIPMQVMARASGREGPTSRALLSDRFQEAVDAAAMVAGLIGSDDYTQQISMDKRPCSEDLDQETAAVVKDLESEWSDDVLRAAIRSGGYREGQQ